MTNFYSVKGTVQINFEIDGEVESRTPADVYSEVLRMLTPPGLISSVVRSGLSIVEVGHKHEWTVMQSGNFGINKVCLQCNTTFNENIHDDSN